MFFFGESTRAGVSWQVVNIQLEQDWLPAVPCFFWVSKIFRYSRNAVFLEKRRLWFTHLHFTDTSIMHFFFEKIYHMIQKAPFQQYSCNAFLNKSSWLKKFHFSNTPVLPFKIFWAPIHFFCFLIFFSQMKKSWYEKNIDFYVHALAYWWSTHPTWTAQYPWKKVLQIRTKLTFKLFFRYQSYQLNQALLVWSKN